MDFVYVVYGYDPDDKLESYSLVFANSPLIHGVYKKLEDAIDVKFELEISESYGHLIWNCAMFAVE